MGTSKKSGAGSTGSSSAVARKSSSSTEEESSVSNSDQIDELSRLGGEQEVGFDGALGSAEREVRSADKGGKRPPGQFQLLGQSFGRLQDLHDWLVAQRADPSSTVPHEPVLRVTLTPGSIVHQREQVNWTYYSPNQQLVIDGAGAVVSGLRGKKRPTPGYFLSYRPIVGTGTMDKPAAANFTMTGLTVRGYESGGVMLSPQTGTDPGNRWEGGNTAAMEGAVIEGNRFEKLGSKNTPEGQAKYATHRFGLAGVEMHGVSDSRVAYNTFRDLENGEVEGTRWGPRLIHAIYARDQSSNNDIVGNRFKDVSGDPIRFSNGSNDNLVAGNRSKNTGVTALVSEHYNPNEGERDSTGNQILPDNRVGRLYGKRRKAKRFNETVSTGKRPDIVS